MSRTPKVAAKPRSKLKAKHKRSKVAKPSGKSGVTKAYVTRLVRELREEVRKTRDFSARQSDLKKLDDTFEARLADQAKVLATALSEQLEAMSALRTEFQAKASANEKMVALAIAEQAKAVSVVAQQAESVAQQAEAMAKLKADLEAQFADANTVRSVKNA
jgi:hypothetical protein